MTSEDVPLASSRGAEVNGPAVRWLILAFAMVTTVPTVPSPVGAAGFTFTTRSVYHAYKIRLSDDRNDLRFRNVNRFYQTLDFAGYGVTGGGTVDTVLSLRYDTDLGTGFHRDTPISAGIPAVSGRDDVDLLYLYVDCRDVLEDRLDVRIGRQLLVDDLDWYSLDGLKATAHLFTQGTRSLDVELYAGLPVQFKVFSASEPLLDSDALANDGTQIRDGPGISFGGSAYARPVEDLAISLAYRQELVIRGEIQAFPGQGDPSAVIEVSSRKLGLEEHLLGASVGYTIRPANVDLYAQGVWSLLVEELDQVRAGVGYNPAIGVHFAGEYLRVRPRFAGDAIFNVFNIFPYDSARGELSWEILRGLTLEGGYFYQVFRGGPKGPKAVATARNDDPSDDGDAGQEFQDKSDAHGPSGGLSYRGEFFSIGAYAETETNLSGAYAFGGNYRYAEIFGDVSLLEQRASALLRLSTTTFQNDWFEDIDSGEVDAPETSFAIDLEGGARIVDAVRVQLRFTKNFRSVLEGSYRLLTSVEVSY